MRISIVTPEKKITKKEVEMFDYKVHGDPFVAVGRIISPGATLQFGMLTGQVIGKWGIGPQNIYNARLDKLPTTWRGAERGVLIIDGFYEKHEFFHKEPGHSIVTAVIYNRAHEFAIVTTDATSQISKWHHRMPMVLNPSSVEKWISAGEANPVVAEDFIVN